MATEFTCPDSNGSLFLGCCKEQRVWEESKTANEIMDYIHDAFKEIDEDRNLCRTVYQSVLETLE